jgi:hypothetical protein
MQLVSLAAKRLEKQRAESVKQYDTSKSDFFGGLYAQGLVTIRDAAPPKAIVTEVKRRCKE